MANAPKKQVIELLDTLEEAIIQYIQNTVIASGTPVTKSDARTLLRHIGNRMTFGDKLHNEMLDKILPKNKLDK